MRYVFKLSYDGTSYAGWQRQKNALSVQEALEKGMESALGVPCRVTASGRTDAGVHAAGQMCHFDAEGLTVPPEKLPDCVNRFLPSDIRILEGWAAARPDFDCNRSAKKKTYCYSLYVSKREIPLKERFSVRVEARFQGVLRVGFLCKDDGADGIFRSGGGRRDVRRQGFEDICLRKRIFV